MAIIHFRLPSGWLPAEDTIANLIDDSNAKLKRHEINENKISLYFEEVRLIYIFFFNKYYIKRLKLDFKTW